MKSTAYLLLIGLGRIVVFEKFTEESGLVTFLLILFVYFLFSFLNKRRLSKPNLIASFELSIELLFFAGSLSRRTMTRQPAPLLIT